MDGGSTETDLLLAPTARVIRVMNGIQSTGKGVTTNRVFIVVLLAVLAVFGLYSENQVIFLKQRVNSMSKQMVDLEALTAAHESVIERFNKSVSNGEVLKRLGLLESNLTATVDMLHGDLADTEAGIQVKLDKTSDLLKSQVVAAEDEINAKVQQVEADIKRYYIETQTQFSMENSFMIFQLAGTFTLLSCLISMWHITAHLRKMNQPMVQRKILAILWMSPVYAITSWFSLVFPSAEGYLAIIKDGYEAYIIYQFLSFCIAVIGKGDRKQVVDILAKHADHLTPPFRLTAIFEICGCVKAPVYESNRQLADEILLQCQLFAMQFVFFRPLTTTAMVVLNQLHYYGKGTQAMDYRAPQLYITVVQNISIFVAFTGLLKFYHAVDNELQWCRPFAKFLCIKGVVFMTFWQGLAISVLAETTDGEAENWASSAQNFLICLEMLLFSIAHFYCFPTEEWEDGYRVKATKAKFGDSIALGDFFSDLKMIVRKKPRSKKKKSEKKNPPPTIEECEEESPIVEALSSGSEEGGSISQSDRTDSELSISQSDRDMIIGAINDSLGEDADDPEIAEATRRLLESNVLSPEFFEAESESDVSESEADDLMDFETDQLAAMSSDLDEAEQGKSSPVLKDEVEREDYLPTEYDPGLSPIKSAEEPGIIEDEESAPSALPSESTPLLDMKADDSTETLRPSIFTSVASIAEQDIIPTEHSNFPR